MRLLMELWPTLVPIALYLLIMHARSRRARKTGAEKLRLKDGPWFWAVLASIAIGVICLLLLGVSAESVKGEYEPPHMEGGKIVPGQVENQ